MASQPASQELKSPYIYIGIWPYWPEWLILDQNGSKRVKMAKKDLLGPILVSTGQKGSGLSYVSMGFGLGPEWPNPQLLIIPVQTGPSDGQYPVPA